MTDEIGVEKLRYRVGKGVLAGALSVALIIGLPGVASAETAQDGGTTATEELESSGAFAAEAEVAAEALEVFEEDPAVSTPAEASGQEPLDELLEETTDLSELDAADTADAADTTEAADTADVADTDDAADADASGIDASDSGAAVEEDAEPTEADDALTNSAIPNAAARTCQQNESESSSEAGRNHHRSNADPLPLGRTMCGVISSRLDGADVFAIDVTRTGNYRLDFSFSKLTGASSSLAYKVQLLNADGAPVRSWDLDSGAHAGGWIGKQVTHLVKGRWYVEVRGNEPVVYKNQYRVRLSATPAKAAETAPSGSATRAERELSNESGLNHHRSNADVVAPGVSVRGGIAGRLDGADVYAIDVSRSGSYKLDFSFDNIGTVPSPAGYKVQLLDSDGKSVRALDVQTTRWKGVKVFEQRLTKGRWYVQVQGLHAQIYKNLYRLKLSLVAADPLNLTTGTPSISGTAKAGSVLTAKPGSWKPTGVTFKYQWLKNGKAISKATKSSYRVASGDAGAKLSVRVTGSRSGYKTASKTSKAVTIASASKQVSKPDRVWGASRYATNYNLNLKVMRTGKPVFIVTGANFPDALSAGPAVSLTGGALVLAAPSGLESRMIELIKKRKPSAIYLIGGKGVVPASIGNQLKKATGKTPIRVAGDNRYLTSSAILDRFFKNRSFDRAFVATGRDFPDALSASAAGGALAAPVLLVDGAASNGNMTGQMRTLMNKKTKKLVIVGGTGVVSKRVEQNLRNSGFTIEDRLFGSNRYATNSDVNAFVTSKTRNTEMKGIWIATGANFPDALSAAAPAGFASQRLVLSNGSCIPKPVVSSWIRGKNSTVAGVSLIGGEGALSKSVANFVECK